MRPVAVIEQCRASHQRLLADVLRLQDRDVREQSLLPGYTRGHVVTHLANKARAHAMLFEGAAAGEIRRLHPADYDPDAAAASGVARPADVLRADLETSLQLLESEWDRFDDQLWDGQAIMMAGPRTMSEVVEHHFRNVEVHHVDLDIGYLPSDWPASFLTRELPKRLADLPSRADEARLLAWLLGRAPAPDLKPW